MRSLHVTVVKSYFSGWRGRAEMKHTLVIYLQENVLLLMHLLLPPFFFNRPMQSYALEVRTCIWSQSHIQSFKQLTMQSIHISEKKFSSPK